MLRKKIFEQNGALVLEDEIKIIGVGSIKTFSAKTLEVATRNYASEMIIGRGGSGNVYKGILPDNRVVAIKKSRLSDPGHFSKQFLNELVILSQINHHNVVQILGCCWETEVPLLAHEYVCNGNLYEHIHDIESGTRRLSWDSRLSIAYDTASALAYLHTITGISIIHRHVKSADILLDENLTAKISDFGGSRLVPLDSNKVTTLVQGTFGYLDPEYFVTNELSNKSDVYSFGVVLAELLTGNKPRIREKAAEERILARYFITKKRENRLREIVDHQVLKEATDEQLKAACDLTFRCLDPQGVNRPSMKEVAIELDIISKLGKHHPFIQDN